MTEETEQNRYLHVRSPTGDVRAKDEADSLGWHDTKCQRLFWVKRVPTQKEGRLDEGGCSLAQEPGVNGA